MDGRGSRLQLACKVLQQLNIDIAILIEAKLNGRHTISSYGYDIMATKITHQSQGGVVIASRRSKDWHLEGGEKFGSNVMKTTLVHDGRRTKIIGAYIPPSETDLQTTHYIDQALTNETPEKCILLGDFNLNYEQPKDHRTELIVDSLKSYDFRNLATKFKSTRKKPYWWTWRKFREGRRVQSICDYIFYRKRLQ